MHRTQLVEANVPLIQNECQHYTLLRSQFMLLVDHKWMGYSVALRQLPYGISQVTWYWTIMIVEDLQLWINEKADHIS